MMTMATITIKIHKNTRKTQHLIGLVRELAKTDKNIEIEDSESPYNREFVKKIRKSEKQPGVKIDLDNLWK